MKFIREHDDNGASVTITVPAIQQLPDSQPTTAAELDKMDSLTKTLDGKIPRHSAEDQSARKAMKKRNEHAENRTY